MVWSIFSEYVPGYSCSNLKFTQYRFQARVIFLVESEFSFYPQQPPAVWADPPFFKMGLPVFFSRDRSIIEIIFQNSLEANVKKAIPH